MQVKLEVKLEVSFQQIKLEVKVQVKFGSYRSERESKLF